MSDLIDRQVAIDAHCELCGDRGRCNCDICPDVEVFQLLPSAQPEIKPIEYRECADAMLKMWIDNVVTDGEYNRIMDKLNAHWGRYNG